MSTDTPTDTPTPAPTLTHTPPVPSSAHAGHRMATVTPSTVQLISALARHQGAKRGVSAELLAARLAVSPRQLRKAISCARADGLAICGHPSTGYYMATTPDELERTCKFLRRRALHSLQRLSRMTGVSMPTLCQQLMLNMG
jgi:biotin operon repressor